MWPEALPKWTAKEKLTHWDKDYEKCDFSKVPELTVSPVSGIVFHPNWCKEIFEQWKFDDRCYPGQTRRYPIRHSIYEQYLTREIAYGCEFRVWRIHKADTPVTFECCGEEYYPPLNNRSRRRDLNNKDHLACTARRSWDVHRTGCEKSHLTFSTRVEKNPEFRHYTLPTADYRAHSSIQAHKEDYSTQGQARITAPWGDAPVYIASDWQPNWL